MVSSFNKDFGTYIFFVDSTGLVKPNPLHPNTEGHETTVKHLTEILRKKYLINNFSLERYL